MKDIKVSEENHAWLQSLKIVRQESFDDLITRIKNKGYQKKDFLVKE